MVPNRGVFTHGGRPEDGGFESKSSEEENKSATQLPTARGGGGEEMREILTRLRRSDLRK
jgi:hypothetical protein